MLQAVVQAANELNAPVILQTTTSTLKYASPDYFAAMARAAAKSSKVPIALHLDHSQQVDMVVKCIHAGYSSVMIDGSARSFEENIALSQRAVEYASLCGVSVEAELGTLGGKEDDIVADNVYTDPEAAREFVERTNVDSLAVAIGTAHGFYKGTPKLDFERLHEIRKRVEIPLVLHGASGLSDEAVQTAIDLGVCKVNFATELREAMSSAVKAYLAKEPEVFDPKKYMSHGREAVYQLVKQRMKVCGSQGKASLY